MEGSGYYASVGIPLSSGVFSRVLHILLALRYSYMSVVCASTDIIIYIYLSDLLKYGAMTFL